VGKDAEKIYESERACFMRSTSEMRLKFYGSDGTSYSTINNKGDAHEEERVDEQQRVIDLVDMPEHIVMVGPKNGDDPETRDLA
jgi:hypothetical protein